MGYAVCGRVHSEPEVYGFIITTVAEKVVHPRILENSSGCMY